MESVVGKKNPTVGIVNIGAEEEKGNALVKETFPLLKECPDINFIGSVEAREIPYGDVDVIVCEAFVGNVILKLYEGVAGALVKKIKSGMMANLKSKIGGLLVKPALKDTLKDFDTSEHGGAPLLGLKGLVVKTHGSSTSKEVCNSIIQCVTFKEQKINEKITSVIQKNQEIFKDQVMRRYYGFEKLQKIIAEVLNLSEEEIRPDSTFVDDLGADSLDVFQIIMGIEEEFDIEIDNEEAEKITTVQDAVDQIKKAVE